jgi:hypothetical protein
MSEFFDAIFAFIDSTLVLQQFGEWNAVGLFTNPWFLVPFIALIIYYLVKQQIQNLILLGLGIAVFLFCGSHYVEGLIDEKGFIQLPKVLPILGMGIAVVGVVVYLFFGRSD